MVAGGDFFPMKPSIQNMKEGSNPNENLDIFFLHAVDKRFKKNCKAAGRNQDQITLKVL